MEFSGEPRVYKYRVYKILCQLIVKLAHKFHFIQILYTKMTIKSSCLSMLSGI